MRGDPQRLRDDASVEPVLREHIQRAAAADDVHYDAQAGLARLRAAIATGGPPGDGGPSSPQGPSGAPPSALQSGQGVASAAGSAKAALVVGALAVGVAVLGGLLLKGAPRAGP